MLTPHRETHQQYYDLLFAMAEKIEVDIRSAFFEEQLDGFSRVGIVVVLNLNRGFLTSAKFPLQSHIEWLDVFAEDCQCVCGFTLEGGFAKRFVDSRRKCRKVGVEAAVFASED